MIDVLIADDHHIWSSGLASLLGQEEDMNIVSIANDGQTAIAMTNLYRPTILLLDIDLPDISGIEVCSLLTETNPSTKIIVISMYNEGNFVWRMMQNGASGYLMKNVTIGELLEAIRTVAMGKTFFSAEALNSIKKKQEEATKKKNVSLIPKISFREKEVLELVAKEYTTQEIASQLNVGLKTVETHRNNLLTKFNVRNSVGLIKKAIELNLLAN